jgi:electron transport complex protein RnfC
MSVLNLFKTPAARVPRQCPGEPEIRDLVAPASVVIPLEYPERLLFKTLVQVGDRVARNQVIARSDHGNCLHAPVSGEMTELVRIWTASGHHVPALKIITEGEEEQTFAQLLAHLKIDSKRATRVELLKACGVISPWTTPGSRQAEAPGENLPEIHHVVLVGHDEEPTQQVLNLLLKKHSDLLEPGLRLLRNVAPRARVWLTINREDRDWAAALVGDLATVVPVSADYRNRLVDVLAPAITGVPVPNQMPYRERGLAVLTIEAALAARAALDGQPFLRKALSVSGSGLERPITVTTVLGTPIGDVLEAIGLEVPEGGRLLAGGPMRGAALYNPGTPVDKFVDGVHLISAEELPAEVNRNCVNCGRCVRACPANLQVHMIGRCVQFGQVAEAVDYHPEACFDCGLCTFVCPARRPLVQLVNMAKSHIRSAS